MREEDGGRLAVGRLEELRVRRGLHVQAVVREHHRAEVIGLTFLDLRDVSITRASARIRTH